MNKVKILIVTSVLALLTFKSKAQDGAYDKGTTVITAGYGIPEIYRLGLRAVYSGYNSVSVRGFGPILLKGDYGIMKFNWGHKVGAGIVLGYSGTSVTYSYYETNTYAYNALYTEKNKYNTFLIGARGTYHYFTTDKLDCYASIGLGFNINTYSYTTNNPRGVAYRSASNRSFLYNSFTAGIRYYFTPNIGVYAEAGWDASAPLQGGLAVKF